MAKNNPDPPPIVIPISSVVQIAQLFVLGLCAYVILRCVHSLKRFSRRRRKGRPNHDNSLLLTDQSRTMTEDSQVTVDDSYDFRHRQRRGRGGEVNHDLERERDREHERNYERSRDRRREHEHERERDRRATNRGHMNQFPSPELSNRAFAPQCPSRQSDGVHRSYSNLPRFHFRAKRQGVPPPSPAVSLRGGASSSVDHRGHDHVTDAVEMNQSLLEPETQHNDETQHLQNEEEEERQVEEEEEQELEHRCPTGITHAWADSSRYPERNAPFILDGRGGGGVDTYIQSNSNEPSSVDYIDKTDEVKFSGGEGGGGGGERRGRVEKRGRNDEQEKDTRHTPQQGVVDSANKAPLPLPRKNREIRIRSRNSSDDVCPLDHHQLQQHSRIKFSDQSAAVTCHRRFLAGTQDEGAFLAFPSSSDRLDCATQFVSRGPSNVINLCSSVPKTYLDMDSMHPGDTYNTATGTEMKESAVQTSEVSSKKEKGGARDGRERERKIRKPSPNHSSQIMRKVKCNSMRGGDCKHASSPSSTFRQDKRSSGRAFSASHQQHHQHHNSPRPIANKSRENKQFYRFHRHGQVGEKNKMSSNSYRRTPNLNMNYAAAAVSLQECGKELDRLIQDTMRNYGDWSLAPSKSHSRYSIGVDGRRRIPSKDVVESLPNPFTSSPFTQGFVHSSAQDHSDCEDHSPLTSRWSDICHNTVSIESMFSSEPFGNYVKGCENANANKVLGHGNIANETVFRYSPAHAEPPMILKGFHDSHQENNKNRPVVVDSLLKELETLMRKINYHYDKENADLFGQNDNDGVMGDRMAVANYPNRTLGSTMERQTPGGDSGNQEEEALLSNKHGNGDTFSENLFKRTSCINSLHLSPVPMSNPRQAFVTTTTTVSNRKKVFEQTCPVPLNETEIVCYMELVPKLKDPARGFHMLKLNNAPTSLPGTTRLMKLYDDTSKRQLSNYKSCPSTTQEDDFDNFSENKTSENKNFVSSTAGLEHLYQEDEDGTLEIACGDFDTTDLTYTARKNVNDMTVTQDSTVGNNTKTRTLKDSCKTTTLNLTLKKTMESGGGGNLANKSSPVQKGSYAAKFRKNLRHKQIAMKSAASPKSKRKSANAAVSAKKGLISQSSVKHTPKSSPRRPLESPGANDRCGLKTTPGSKTDSPTSSPKRRGYGKAIFQNRFNTPGLSFISPKSHNEKYQRGRKFKLSQKTTLDSSRKTQMEKVMGPDKTKFNGKHYSERVQTTKASDKQATIRTVKNKTNKTHGKRKSQRSSLKSIEKSRDFADAVQSHYPPLGPTESVRFEMKSALAFKIGQIQSSHNQKLEQFRGRQIALSKLERNSLAERDHQSLLQREGFDRHHFSRDPIENEVVSSPLENSNGVFDIDSGTEGNKAVTHDIVDDDKKRALPSRFRFYHKRRLYDMKESQQQQDNSTRTHTIRNSTTDRRPKSPNTLLKNIRASSKRRFDPSTRSFATETDTLHRPYKLLKKRACDNDRSKCVIRNLPMGIDQAKYARASHATHSPEKYLSQHSTSSHSPTCSPRNERTVAFDCGETGATSTVIMEDKSPSKNKSLTLTKKSCLSRDDILISKRQQGRLGNHRTTEQIRTKYPLKHASVVGRGNQFFHRRATHFPKGSIESSSSEDILLVGSGRSTFVAEKGKGRRGRPRSRWLRSNHRKSSNLCPNVSERRYKKRMKNNALGVAQYLEYCETSSTNDEEGSEQEDEDEQEEEELSSSSTCFLLDTLDEISESLSDDNIMYW